MRRVGLPLRLAGGGVALALAVLLVLWLVPSSSYIVLPDRAKPVEPLVTVPHEGIHAGPGGIYYVDVLVRRATLLEKIFPWIQGDATLLPAAAVNAPGQSDSQRRAADLQDMARSQDIAAAVALKALGYEVVARTTGVLVAAVDPGAPAAGRLQPSDLITALDGKPVTTIASLRAAMAAKKPGDAVRYTVTRAKRTLTVTVRTVAAGDDPKRAIAGFAPEQGSQVKLPVAVRIDAGEVGGPSAGLAFALDVLEEVGHRELDRGNVVAATGEIFLDGTVGPVGGLKQKTLGARRAGATIFLVPAGDNAAVARRYAGGMRVVAVESFQQALSVLATLAAKH